MKKIHPDPWFTPPIRIQAKRFALAGYLMGIATVLSLEYIHAIHIAVHETAPQPIQQVIYIGQKEYGLLLTLNKLVLH